LKLKAPELSVEAFADSPRGFVVKLALFARHDIEKKDRILSLSRSFAKVCSRSLAPTF